MDSASTIQAAFAKAAMVVGVVVVGLLIAVKIQEWWEDRFTLDDDDWQRP